MIILEEKETHFSSFELIKTRKELFAGNIKYRSFICNLFDRVIKISGNNFVFNFHCILFVRCTFYENSSHFLFQLSVCRDSLQRPLPKRIHTTIRSRRTTRIHFFILMQLNENNSNNFCSLFKRVNKDRKKRRFDNTGLTPCRYHSLSLLERSY